jgi:hypothetical protein
MALTVEAFAQLVLDGTEQDLFVSQTTLAHYSTKIFFNALAANDEVIVRVYDFDEQNSVERIYRITTVVGVQVTPELLINWIPSTSYRVTVQQTNTTFKTISWALYSA